MTWLMYPAAIAVGALAAFSVVEPPPDYVATWATTHVRTVPNGDIAPTPIQRPYQPPEDCIERFAKLPALAERLKVPQTADTEPSVVIEMCDGRKWDVFDILQALLDRMESKL